MLISVESSPGPSERRERQSDQGPELKAQIVFPVRHVHETVDYHSCQRQQHTEVNGTPLGS